EDDGIGLADEAQQLAPPVLKLGQVAGVDLRRQSPRLQRLDQPLGERKVTARIGDEDFDAVVGLGSRLGHRNALPGARIARCGSGEHSGSQSSAQQLSAVRLRPNWCPRSWIRRAMPTRRSPDASGGGRKGSENSIWPKGLSPFHKS